MTFHSNFLLHASVLVYGITAKKHGSLQIEFKGNCHIRPGVAFSFRLQCDPYFTISGLLLKIYAPTNYNLV